jgi:general secretion pathway protein F
MPVFQYKGLDGAGKAINGIIDADTAKVARGRLRKQGLFPTEIHQQQDGAARKGQSLLDTQIDVSKIFEFVSARDISTMTTQLATLVGAHVPMAEALAALVDQTEKSKLKVILSRVKERVNEGAPLADALSDHPTVFDNLYIQMVRAGEKSGALDQVLNRLASFADGQVKLQGQIISAMAYPVLLGMVGFAIMMFLFMGVLPKIRGLFDSLPGGDDLPLITDVVFFFGDMLVGYWWMVPLILVPTIILFRRWLKTKAGRRRFDAFKLKLPIVGKMNRLIAVSRFCRTLSTLLVSGVPIVGALNIVERVVGNVIIAEAVSSATANIMEGASIAAPLKASGEFPPLVTHMIGIGERTGELERMLTVVADSYEDQVQATITAMTSLLGPLMILGVGGTVFVIALGLLTPMMNISQMIK